MFRKALASGEGGIVMNSFIMLRQSKPLTQKARGYNRVVKRK